VPRLSREDLVRWLADRVACDSSQDWVGITAGEPEQLWFACEDGEWLWWLIAEAFGRSSPEGKRCATLAALTEDDVWADEPWKVYAGRLAKAIRGEFAFERVEGAILRFIFGERTRDFVDEYSQ
jgi:hypothetical protein